MKLTVMLSRVKSKDDAKNNDACSNNSYKSNDQCINSTGMCSVHSMGLGTRLIDHSVFIKPSSSLPLREGGREQIAGEK